MYYVVFCDWLLLLRSTVLGITPAGSLLSLPWLGHIQSHAYTMFLSTFSSVFGHMSYFYFPVILNDPHVNVKVLRRCMFSLVLDHHMILFFLLPASSSFSVTDTARHSLKDLKGGIPRVWVSINYWSSLSGKQKSSLAGSSFTLGGTHRHALWWALAGGGG